MRCDYPVLNDILHSEQTRETGVFEQKPLFVFPTNIDIHEESISHLQQQQQQHLQQAVALLRFN